MEHTFEAELSDSLLDVVKVFVSVAVSLLQLNKCVRLGEKVGVVREEWEGVEIGSGFTEVRVLRSRTRD